MASKFIAYSFSAWDSPIAIENYLFAVKRYLWQKTGSSLEAERTIDPLTWYISTGRASTLFLCGLLQIQPWRVGRSLMKGGSVDEAVNRIKGMVIRSADRRLSTK